MLLKGVLSLILKFWKEIEDTEGEADMEELAHSQSYVIYPEQSQRDVF